MSLTLRIIPSLLASNDRLVKGINFKNHLDVGDPITTSKSLEAQGADEILLVSLDHYKNPKIEKDSLSLLRNISKNLMTAITFGGGIDSFSKAKECLKQGADKVLISSALFKNIKVVNEISKVFGNQSIVCGINITEKKGKYFLYENPNLNLNDWLEKINKLPTGEIKITFVNLEGSKKGPDLKFCKELISFFNHPVIIEGGIGNLQHIKKIAKLAPSGLALGTMLNFSEQNIIKIKQFLTNEKISIRR